jgi:protein phosphatase
MQPAPVLPAVEYAERSDPGRDPDKQINEDVCMHRATRFGHLCVVCDGMGGHAAGREAAELAAATIVHVFEQALDGTSPAEVLKRAVEEASRRIHEMRTSEVAMGRPGSTAVAILLHAQGTEVVHVGDSRAYLVHEGQISRLTRDHSIVQELVDRGLLTPEQASHHPDANRITRALGMSTEVEAELRPQPVPHLAGDAFVLCSDGLCDLVADREILAIVGAEPAAQAVGKLVDLANARGGHDNITVAVLRARETVSASAVPVAPTVVQTSITAPATIPAVSSTRTLVEPERPHVDPNQPEGAEAPFEPRAQPPSEPRVEHPTQPQHPVGAVPVPPEPPAYSRPLPPAPRGGSSRALVFLAIGLAVVAFALLAAVLIAHLEERGGKRSPAIAVDGGAR